MVTYNASYFTSIKVSQGLGLVTACPPVAIKVSQWLGLVTACPPVATFKMFLGGGGGGGGMPQDLSLLGPLHTVYYAMLIVVNYMTTTGSSRSDSRWTNVFF